MQDVLTEYTRYLIFLFLMAGLKEVKTPLSCHFFDDRPVCRTSIQYWRQQNSFNVNTSFIVYRLKISYIYSNFTYVNSRSLCPTWVLLKHKRCSLFTFRPLRESWSAYLTLMLSRLGEILSVCHALKGIRERKTLAVSPLCKFYSLSINYFPFCLINFKVIEILS